MQNFIGNLSFFWQGKLLSITWLKCQLKLGPLFQKSPAYSWYCNTLPCTYTVYFFWLQSHHATAPNKCPGQWCSFVGVPRKVSGHWRSVHDRELVMHYCSFPQCSYKTPKAQSLCWQWKCAHQASKPQSKELKTLPPLVELMCNRLYQHIGNDPPMLTPALLPVDSIPIEQKSELVPLRPAAMWLSRRAKCSHRHLHLRLQLFPRKPAHL